MEQLTNVFAKTKSGLVINLRLESLASRGILDGSQWIAERNGVELKNITISTTQGVYVISLSNVQVEKILGIKQKPGAFVEVFNYSPDIQKNFNAKLIKEIKIEAEKLVISRIEFQWHSSDKFTSFKYFGAQGERIDSNLTKYNTLVQRFQSAVKVLKSEQIDKMGYQTGSDYGDYSLWYDYTAPADAMLSIIELGEKAVEEADTEKLEKEQAEKLARQAKFDEAKASGKPVLLTSYFLTGNDIPKHLRDEDSDMGTAYSWAMPDGTVTSTFSHAY